MVVFHNNANLSVIHNLSFIVSVRILCAFCIHYFLFFFFQIIATEFANEARLKRDARGQVTVLLGRRIPRVIWNIYMKIGVFLFGACMSQLTTDIAKYSIGRLRPHFLFVCQSDVNCTAPGTDPHRYIEEFVCKGKDLNRIREARFVQFI